MRKPIGLVGSLTLLLTLVGALALPSSTGAATRLGGKVSPALITAAGTVTCTKVKGTATFSPKLTRTGTPGGDKFQFKLTTNHCTGQAGGGGQTVTVTGAILTITGYWNPTNSCAGLATDVLGTNIAWKFKWISAPAITPTSVSTTAGTPWLPSGAIYKFNFPQGGGTISASSGSFAPVSPLTASFRTAIANPCTAGWGPYPTTTVTSGTFTIN